MRQVGILCAAAFIALKDNVGRLEDDHRKAKILAGLNLFIFFVLYIVKKKRHVICPPLVLS